MRDRRCPAPRYPLTADLAGVLAATVPERASVRQERTEFAKRFVALLARLGRRSTNPVADKPLDSIPTVR